MQKTFRKRKVRPLVCLLFLLIIVFFCYFENNVITVSEFIVSDKKIPQSFDGVVIAHVSDLHNKMFGDNQSRLVGKIKEWNPDLIVITGDLIDSNRPDVEKGLALVREAVKIAPVYFVTGNHDNWLSDTDTFELFRGLEDSGAVVLKDEKRKLVFGKNEEYITLIGLDDDTLCAKSDLRKALDSLIRSDMQSADQHADKISEEVQRPFVIMLAHQPQLLPVYSEYDIDLVLSGHAHGGQFRIPFIGGFVAPDQGFLPKYTKGMYEENNTKMIVSAGLGNSVVPQRLLNRPELVKITLKCK
ncbi:MAG: metallophosphoesterase [Lachnospiraceae bacterium]|nr:metallophosphoesterase [Lachnospiraceae bacterium]